MELNEEVRISHRRRSVESGGGSAMTVAIAWGDLATAYVSTGIPNIETYASMPLAAAIASRALNSARPLARLRTRSGAAAPARGPHPGTLRGASRARQIPALGPG